MMIILLLLLVALLSPPQSNTKSRPNNSTSIFYGKKGNGEGDGSKRETGEDIAQDRR